MTTNFRQSVWASLRLLVLFAFWYLVYFVLILVTASLMLLCVSL